MYYGAAKKKTERKGKKVKKTHRTETDEKGGIYPNIASSLLGSHGGSQTFDWRIEQLLGNTHSTRRRDWGAE